MSVVKVSGEDVLLVQCISALLSYKVGTKMEGQSYRRYNFGGKVFTSNDESFYTALEAGGVSTITLDANEEGQLSLTGFITFAKLIGLKKNNLMIEALTVENFKPENVGFNALVG